MRLISRIPSVIPLCPDGFAGPRGTRPLLDEARTLGEARALRREPIWSEPGMPHGEHRPVLLIPGFMTGDVSMSLLARWLQRAGYAALRSQLRMNVDCSQASVDRVARRVEIAALHEGRPVTLIGHSLGGMLAKTVAIRRPDLVAGVIALGSPLLAPTATHRLLLADVALLNTLSRVGLRRLMTADCVHGDCAADAFAELSGPFPAEIPFVSIYSRSDGIIDWQACLDPAAEAVEVDSSHCGMPVNSGVYRALATHLPALSRTRYPGTGAAAC